MCQFKQLEDNMKRVNKVVPMEKKKTHVRDRYKTQTAQPMIITNLYLNYHKNKPLPANKL